MTFDSKLTDLSPTDVLSTEKLIVTYINEAFPDLDLTPGSVHRDIIVNLYAALEQRVRDGIDKVLKSNSLLEITKDPTIADDVQVDRVLSNYNITRSGGSKASGYVKIIIDADRTTLMPIGTRLTINSLEFRVTSSIRAVSSTEAVEDPEDISLVRGTGGTYFFNVPVESVGVGSKYNIKEGSKVTGISPKVARVVTAEAAQTLLGGKDSETNEELITKLKQGVTGKILGGRAHIEAKLKDEFPSVISAGATGFGDSEMTRDSGATVSKARAEILVDSAATVSDLNGTSFTLVDSAPISQTFLFNSSVTDTGAIIGLSGLGTAASIADKIRASIVSISALDISAGPDPVVANTDGHFPVQLTQGADGAEGNTLITATDITDVITYSTDFSGGGEPQLYHRGGMIDVHVRTAFSPLVETVSVTATQNTDNTNHYDFILSKEQCNGLYAVSQVKLEDSTDIGTLCIVEYDRFAELPTSGPAPSINTGIDIGFSSYQKVRIKVKDTESSGATAVYSVQLLKLPFISTIQDYVAYGENRSVAADMVIKAAVPIFCGCNIKVVKPKAAADIDIFEIQIAIANAVNSVPFGRPIPVSLIAHTVHSHLPENAFIDFPIKLFGNLYYPDKPKFESIDNSGLSFGDEGYDTGEPDIRQIRTTDTLRAPHEPMRGVSDKTVAFFLSPYSINLTVAEV